MADEELGTALAGEHTDLAPTPDTIAPAGGATEPKQPESFINPADLPDDIKPHWKRMHGAYTKALEKFNARKADHELLDNFRGNPNYALELLRAEAQARGLQLTPVNGTSTTAAAPARSSTEGPPARVIEAIRARLDPSLQWMAESLAAGQWEAAQESVKPIREENQAREKASRSAEYASLSTRLTDSAPGWEAHQDDMDELLTWLQSRAMTHPRHGDKLTFLYNAVTNGSAAKAAAIRDMAAAGRNATRTGLSGRPTIANTTERVMKARNTFEATRVAAEEAARELREQGVTLPD